MKHLFAVIRSHGPAFNPALPLEEQERWQAHADFMNALQAEGLVVMGGPLEGTQDVLLIMRASGPEELRSRLAEDPWSRMEFLRITLLALWTLRLGSLD